MNFEELFARRASHIKPGLERIRKSFEALGRPAAKIPAVLVGGTNGKGSTSGFIWALLNHSKQNVGLYSSPHLVDFSERFQMSGRAVTDTLVAEEYDELIRELPEELNEELSFFEIATLLGFRLFERFNADFQVLEVGLGGRWDATNISDPRASIVVSVSRDHQEFLGTELLSILREKLAIARAGRPLFWGAQGEVMDEIGLKDAIAESIKGSGAILYSRGEEFWSSADAIHLRLPGLRPLDLRFQGIFAKSAEFLRKNLSIAAAFYHWQASTSQGFAPLESIWESFCEGGARAPLTLVGRSQRIIGLEDPPRRYLIDVCHNPDGARAFAASLKSQFANRKLPGFVSILKDKDCDHILDILRSVLSPVILFGIESERAWNKARLALRHQTLPFHPSLQDAIASDISVARRDEPWVICGSVAAVGHALKTMKVSPKEMSLASIISGNWPSHALCEP
jgi:dihydrofolate synthase/folylpolyglutamate synthase